MANERGSKRDYRKITVTLPPTLYRVLVKEQARRKIAGITARTISAIVTEWLTRSLGETT